MEVGALENVVRQHGLVQHEHGLDIADLRHYVNELTQELRLRMIRNTVDRAMDLCPGTDEESTGMRLKLKNIHTSLNR